VKKRAICCPGIVLFLVLASGCSPMPEVYKDFRAYRYEAAMEKLEPLLEKQNDKDIALNNLRYASCALYAGHYDKAKERFIVASQIMEDFQPKGEFKAVIIAEETKDYRGDPYEKMMAFFYLGLLDYRDGEYDKALADFKTASLADAGSEEERYKSDSALIFFMMAKCFQKLGEPENAREFLQAAKNVAYFNVAIKASEKAMVRATNLQKNTFKKNRDKKYCARAGELILAELSRAATEKIDARTAAQFAADLAHQKLLAQAELPKKKRDKKYLLGYKPEVLAEHVAAIRDRALSQIDALDTSMDIKNAKAFASALDDIFDAANNVLFYIELGTNPYKYRMGQYGEIGKIGRAAYPEALSQIFVDGESFVWGLQTESVYYQAVTRGGREMDSILKGKAVFKSAMQTGGTIALAAAAAMASTSSFGGDNRAAGYAAAAGLAMYMLAAATNPAADIRCWEFLPDRILLCAGRIPAGKHKIDLHFYNGKGEELTAYRQEWVDMEVLPDRDTVFIFRSGPNKPTNIIQVSETQ